MPRIKLNTDKLVGYMRADGTKTGTIKLGTAKLGCTVESSSPPKSAPMKRVPAAADERA